MLLTSIWTHSGPLFTNMPSCFAHLIGGVASHTSLAQKHRKGQESFVLNDEQAGGGGGMEPAAQSFPQSVSIHGPV